ncbi:MAG: YlxM family DNA-binding protein [Lactimicrobium sp.]|jgi:predicted DNA-binding protein YlxM (UPF0122 family)|uniref:YlxM family DNA-binding protein n=1 Tax=Lactimicrobium sp. TaxID=2563780 RepID=UPI002F35250B
MSSERETYNRLYDFYGSLLTNRQQNIFTLYYQEDLSLMEIAENEGISRAAVSDTLRHCRDELNGYEDKLHLLSSFEKRMQYYEQIRKLSSSQVGKLLDACINTEIEGGKNE